MSVTSDLADLIAFSESAGAMIERRRIVDAIAALSIANTDEREYRHRLLAAIEPVTTVRELAGGAGPRARLGNPTGSPTAAVEDQT